MNFNLRHFSLWAMSRARSCTRRCIAPGLLAIFAVGVLAGRLSAEGVSADSAWWQAVADNARADAVHAGIDAYQDGWARGSDAEGLRIDIALRSAADAGLVAKSASDYVDKVVYKKGADGIYVSYQAEPEFRKTFGAYEALLDDFYTRHPEASSVTFGSILTCLADKPVVSCDDVAKHHS